MAIRGERRTGAEVPHALHRPLRPPAALAEQQPQGRQAFLDDPRVVAVLGAAAGEQDVQAELEVLEQRAVPRRALLDGDAVEDGEPGELAVAAHAHAAEVASQRLHGGDDRRELHVLQTDEQPREADRAPLRRGRSGSPPAPAPGRRRRSGPRRTASPPRCRDTRGRGARRRRRHRRSRARCRRTAAATSGCAAHPALRAAPLPCCASGCWRVTTWTRSQPAGNRASRRGVASVDASSTHQTWAAGNWSDEAPHRVGDDELLVEARHDEVPRERPGVPPLRRPPPRERHHDQQHVRDEADAQQERGGVERGEEELSHACPPRPAPGGTRPAGTAASRRSRRAC